MKEVPKNNNWRKRQDMVIEDDIHVPIKNRLKPFDEVHCNNWEKVELFTYSYYIPFIDSHTQK